jgi:tRNA (Thr-GGU) A37 N-methylase
VRLVSRKDATLTVSGLDAIDGSPVLDIKPWYPPYDRPVEEVRVPEYVYRLSY